MHLLRQLLQALNRKHNETMRKEGKPYYDPYLKRVVKDGAEEDNVSRLAEYISKLDNDQMVDVVKLLLQK